MSTPFKKNDLVKTKVVIEGRKMKSPNDRFFVSASLQPGAKAYIADVHMVPATRDTIDPSREITTATATAYRYKLEAQLAEKFTVYDSVQEIPGAQCRIKHNLVSFEEGGVPHHELLKSRSQVFYIGTQTLTFKGYGGIPVEIKTGTPLGVTSDAKTNTGSSHKAISIVNAYYDFQIMKAREIHYTFRSSAHIYHEHLEAA